MRVFLLHTASRPNTSDRFSTLPLRDSSMPSAMWLTLTWEEASAPPWMLHTSFRAVSYILTGGSTTPAVAAAASTSMASSPAAPAAITAVSSHVKVSSSFIPNAASMRLLAPINSLSPTALPLNPAAMAPDPRSSWAAMLSKPE